MSELQNTYTSPPPSYDMIGMPMAPPPYQVQATQLQIQTPTPPYSAVSTTNSNAFTPLTTTLDVPLVRDLCEVCNRLESRYNCVRCRKPLCESCAIEYQKCLPGSNNARQAVHSCPECQCVVKCKDQCCSCFLISLVVLGILIWMIIEALGH